MEGSEDLSSHSQVAVMGCPRYHIVTVTLARWQ
eukprot:COSAG02_NODE_67035_length_254_cov_0.593548_1_plen_32_part_10